VTYRIVTDHPIIRRDGRPQDVHLHQHCRRRQEGLCPVSRSDPEHARGVISRDETCLLLAERKYGGSQLDWLLQKDQVARIEFNGLQAGVGPADGLIGLRASEFD